GVEDPPGAGRGSARAYPVRGARAARLRGARGDHSIACESELAHRRLRGDRLLSSYDLLRSLLARGAYLRVENGRLLCTAPEGGLSAQEVELLKAKRDELIALLAAQGNPAASPDALPEEPGDNQPSTGQERLWTLCMLEHVAGPYNQGLAL